MHDVGTSVHAVLGTWHVYKQAVLVIWAAAAESFLAPLWHHLYPMDVYFKKPRLYRATHFFSIIRLAFFASPQAASLRKQLDTAVAKLSKLAKPPNELNHLINLRALLLWFIPAVSAHHLSHETAHFSLSPLT